MPGVASKRANTIRTAVASAKTVGTSASQIASRAVVAAIQNSQAKGATPAAMPIQATAARTGLPAWTHAAVPIANIPTAKPAARLGSVTK